MANGFIENIVKEIMNLLQPLRVAVTGDDPLQEIKDLFLDLGLDLEEILVDTVELQPVVADLEEVFTILQSFFEDPNNIRLDRLHEIKKGLTGLVDACEKLNNLDVEEEHRVAAGEIGRRLLNYLICIYLKWYHYRIYNWLELLQVISRQPKVDQVYYTIDYTIISMLFTDTENFLDTFLCFATDHFDPYRLLFPLQRILLQHGLLSKFSAPLPCFDQIINPTGSESSASNIIDIPLLTGNTNGSDMNVGLYIFPLEPTDSGNDGGLALTLYGAGNLSQTISLGSNWQFKVRTSADAAIPYALLFRPDGLTVVSLVDGNAIGELNLDFSLLHQVDHSTPLRIFGSDDGSRLETEKIGVRAGLQAALSAENSDFFIEFLMEKIFFLLDTKGGDSFLSAVLPEDGISGRFDIRAGYATKDRFYFGGSSGLEVTIPIHKKLAAIVIETIVLGISLSNNGLKLVFAVSVSGNLGPASFSVKEVGAIVNLSFPEDKNGNLGPLQLGFDFKPPVGAGLAVNTSGITGGGFIEYDPGNRRYAGILGLNFDDIGLTAIALITTRMPDGSDGFSMLVNIGVTFSPAITLPYYFKLIGVGGTIGINRSMSVDALRTGLKNKALDSILFPDPSTVVLNANKIISDMRAVFPPAEGRYVVGPMVKLTWGSESLVTADIGIFFELPAPIEIVLLGQVNASLPKPEEPVVILRLDILGVLDIYKKELTFQATLFDSQIKSYPISGDSAFILAWGDDPRFALSLGGFHPKFTPPPPPAVFADMSRLSIDFSKDGNFQIVCRAYQALTPNTLQFGARANIYAKKGGAKLDGTLGFDALIYFSPFSFEVDISGGVQVKYQGMSSEIRLSMTLSGPTPWHAKGKIKIDLYISDVTIPFNYSWGSERKAKLDPIDPWEGSGDGVSLRSELESPGNWSSVLPVGATMVETLRSFDEEPNNIIVHPSGRLEIRQNVVPLGIGLEKVANAPVTGHDKIDILDILVDGDSLNPEAVEEYFARGQFEKLSSSQKLSLPSFEKMKGGAITGASGALQIIGTEKEKKLGYESIIIREDRTSQTQSSTGTSAWAEAKYVARAGAVQRARHRAGSRQRFAELRVQPKVGINEEHYCIANADDLTRAEVLTENGNLTRVAADQALNAAVKNDPDMADRLIVVPEYEVAA